MTAPTYTARVAFVNSPFDASPTWVDLSTSMMSFSIRRGRQWELNRMETGTAVVTLLNLAGDFWPTKAAGTYYPNVKPWKRINVQATYGGTTYDLYTGFVESWQPGFLTRPIKGPTMTLSCSDLIKNLSNLLLNDAGGYASEKTGARVGHVLDTLGWPAGSRTIDTGQTTLQATGALVNVGAMDHLFTVEDTELGIIFIAPDGKVVFQDRHGRLFSPFTVSQGTFGDDLGAGDLPYTDISPEYGDTRIYNDIRVTRLSGTEQVATDATSATAYGKRGLSRPSLLMTTDVEALAQAQYLLNRYKQPAMRIKQIELQPDPAHEAALYAAMLGFDISTRVKVKLAAATLNSDYHIEGINHDWNRDKPGVLTTKWMLADALNQGSWIWDSALWDTDTWAY